MKKSFKTYANEISQRDLLFNCLLGFICLFGIAFIMMSMKAITQAQISTKAEFIVTMTWDADKCDDIDLWTEDPLGNLIWFSNLENGLTHLDRDDLGCRGDALMINGEKVKYPYNQEILTIRQIISGEWIINAHYYTKDISDSPPPMIEVKVEKLNPNVVLIAFERFQLEKVGDEITVVRFTMERDGQVVSVNRLFKALAAPTLLDRYEESEYNRRFRPEELPSSERGIP